MNFKPSKYYIIKKITEIIEANPNAKILDLGSGSSQNWIPLLKKKPNTHYLGIEPGPSALQAQKLLSPYPNTKIIQSKFEGLKELNESFDIVVSLSVLEHIKHIRQFIEFSADKLKKKGTLIHLYDLGHYYYPSGILERAQTIFCSTPYLKELAPDLKFTAYVRQTFIEKLLEEKGIKITNRTYHNMPQHISLLKNLKESDVKALEQITKFEVDISPAVEKIQAKIREKLFPSVCVWGTK